MERRCDRNHPPFALFVNDPKLFGESYRRYIEKQFRQNSRAMTVRRFDYYGWGKSVRDVERAHSSSSGANRATKVRYLG